MKLSTKGRYGVKAMVHLAIHYGKGAVSIKVIAKENNISEYYLEQLFSTLRKGGLIKSTRGARGGYVLSKSPKETSVQDIMMLLEGPVEISDCLSEDCCDNMDKCPTRLLWVRLQDSIENVMKSTTLQDMVDDHNNMRTMKFTNITREI